MGSHVSWSRWTLQRRSGKYGEPMCSNHLQAFSQFEVTFDRIWFKFLFPKDPCMVYLPTSKNQPDVGKCTIHGSYGFCHWLIFERCYKGQRKQFPSYLICCRHKNLFVSAIPLSVIVKTRTIIQISSRRSLFKKKKRDFPQKLSIDYSSVVFFVYLVGGFNPSQKY